MEIVKLEDIAEIIAGQSPPSDTYNTEGIGMPFFQGKTDFGELYPTIRMYCSRPNKIAKPNDILLSVRAPVGPTNLAHVESCIGRGLSAIRPGRKVSTNFLLYYFRYFEKELVSKSRGSTFDAITQDQIRKLEIPLPDLKIQQEIAHVLEQADKARQQRKAANALTNDFLQSSFLSLFGDPVKNEKGWEVKTLEEVCDKITDGTHHSPVNLEQGDYKYITAKNIKAEGILLNNISYVSADAHKAIYSRCNPEFQDVLYIKDGVTTGIAVVNHLEEEFSMLSSVALLKCNRKILSPYFLAAYLNNESVYDGIRKNMGGAAITRLTLQKINSIKIILPPLSLQQQFAAIVAEAEALRKKQQESEQELEQLFQSLLQKYFG